MKMKTMYMALCLGVWVCLPLSAQLKVGGFVNLNIAGISVKPDISTEDYGSYLGLGLGGIVNYTLMDGLELQAEPMILQKGGTIQEFGDKVILKITYFEIPVFVRYIIPVNAPILPYVMAGPNLGFRASAKAVYPGEGSSNENDQFSALDLGLGLGAGTEYLLGNLILFGQLKYVFGLNDINAESGESKVRNRGLQIQMGVKVPLDIAGD